MRLGLVRAIENCQCSRLTTVGPNEDEEGVQDEEQVFESSVEQDNIDVVIRKTWK